MQSAAQGYQEVGRVDSETVEQALAVLEHANWQIIEGEGTNYMAWTGAEGHLSKIEGLTDLWPRSQWMMAWYVVLPPHGHLHRHSDGDKHYQTYHIPLQTNKEAICYMYEPERVEYRLEVGKVYRVNRGIEHESVNNGVQDRIHLLVDIKV